jgi:hypothetical protein
LLFWASEDVGRTRHTDYFGIEHLPVVLDTTKAIIGETARTEIRIEGEGEGVNEEKIISLVQPHTHPSTIDNLLLRIIPHFDHKDVDDLK